MKNYWFIFLIVGSLLTGCSSTIRYPNTINKNITIHLTIDKSSGIFNRVETTAGVNDINKDCTSDYKGFIKLKPGVNKLGLKPEKLTFLALEVLQGGYSSVATFQQGTLLKPKKGRKYEVVMKYVDNMFDLRLYEIRKSKRKQLELIPFSACKATLGLS